MAQYVKRPVVVEAEQWFPGKVIPNVETADFMGDYGVFVRTMHGDRLPLEPGDWVIQEAMPGRAYKCSAEAFRRIYDPFTGPGGTQDAATTGAD